MAITNRAKGIASINGEPYDNGHIPKVGSKEKAEFFKQILSDGNEPAQLEDIVKSELLQPLVDMTDDRLKSNPRRNFLPRSLRQHQNFTDKTPFIIRALLEAPTHHWSQEVYDQWLQMPQEQFEEARERCRAGKLSKLLDPSSSKLDYSVIACTIWALGYHQDENWKEVLQALLFLFKNQSSSPPVHAPSSINKTMSSSQESVKVPQHPKRSTPSLTRVGNENVHLKGEVETLEKKVTTSRDELQELRQDRSKEKQQHDEQVVELKQDINGLNSELGEQKLKIVGLNTKFEQEKKQKNRAVRSKEDLDTQLADEQKQHEQSKKKLTQLENENGMLQTEIDETPKKSEAIMTYLKVALEDSETQQYSTQGKPKQEHERITKVLREVINRLKTDVWPQPATSPTKRISNPSQSKAAIKFESLGGGDEIGASCYLLTIGDAEVLIDCGIRMNQPDMETIGPDLKRLFPLTDEAKVVKEPPRNLILTHAHNDHSGWLPVLKREIPNLRIWCTKETEKLLSVMLKDSYQQILGQYEEEKRKWKLDTRSTEENAPYMPYERSDIQDVLDSVNILQFGDAPKTIDSNLQFSFMRAGHILGAASVLFRKDGRRVLISGDYSTFQQQTVNPCNWEDAQSVEIDLLVSESTYGDCEKHGRGDSEKLLIDEIRHVTSGGGTVLIPCFALGRAQEIIKIINLAFEREDLKRCRVWVHGMITDINPIYKEAGPSGGRLFEFSDDFVQIINRNYEISDVVKYGNDNPMIVISTSGMMTGGPVKEYAEKLLENGKNKVLLVGYQDDGSVGNKLLKLSHTDKSKRILDLGYNEHTNKQIRIQVGAPAKMIRLSAHSDLCQMRDAIVAVKPKNVVLVHGGQKSRSDLALALREAGLTVAVDPNIEIP